MDALEDQMEELATEEHQMILEYQKIKVARAEDDAKLQQRRERENSHWDGRRRDRDRREDVGTWVTFKSMEADNDRN